MPLSLYCVLFGILLFCHETETAETKFTLMPSNPSYAVEGEDFLLEWTYTVNGSLGLVKFSNVSGSKTDPIGTRFGPGAISSKPKYVARFRAQATSTRAELRIQAVRLSDETTYQLIVVSSDTSSITNNVEVIVQSPANNIVTSNDETITARAELTLSCSADGKPTPTIFWTRVSDNTNVTMPLNITGGKNEESYRCTAYNGVGNPLTKVVKITIHFHPKVILAQKVFVGRGKTASLTCEVKGNPPPTISWSPCDVQNLLCNKQNLSIPKVQTAHANYTCTATNALGGDSATTLLLIGGKNIYLRLSVSAECDKNVSVWETLKRKLPLVFANTTQNYTGAELLNVTCGSLIFDVVLKFSIEVAEDDTIFLIQSAARDGKLGGLSVNVSYLSPNPGVPQTTITTPTSTTPKSGNKTGLIVGVVVGSVAFVALIVFIVWCVRKKKCSGERKEVSDTAQGRKGKGQNGGDEVAYASASMLPHSKRPVEKASQSTGQALPMYAQVDKTKKTSNKGGAPQRQRQRQPGELQYAEVEHVTSGKSLPRKSSSEPIKPSNEEIVYADLV